MDNLTHHGPLGGFLANNCEIAPLGGPRDSSETLHRRRASKSSSIQRTEDRRTGSYRCYSPTVERPASETPIGATSNTSPQKRLQVLSQDVTTCTKCDELCAHRTQTVFGVGIQPRRLCFFGEAPGADEDRLGEPFVAKLVNYLTRSFKLAR